MPKITTTPLLQNPGLNIIGWTEKGNYYYNLNSSSITQKVTIPPYVSGERQLYISVPHRELSETDNGVITIKLPDSDKSKEMRFGEGTSSNSSQSDNFKNLIKEFNLPELGTPPATHILAFTIPLSPEDTVAEVTLEGTITLVGAELYLYDEQS